MPVEGLAEALGFHSNAVPRLVFLGGLPGAVGGFGLMWWISVIAYPHNVAWADRSTVGPPTFRLRSSAWC